MRRGRFFVLTTGYSTPRQIWIISSLCTSRYFSKETGYAPTFVTNIFFNYWLIEFETCNVTVTQNGFAFSVVVGTSRKEGRIGPAFTVFPYLYSRTYVQIITKFVNKLSCVSRNPITLIPLAMSCNILSFGASQYYFSSWLSISILLIKIDT